MEKQKTEDKQESTGTKADLVSDGMILRHDRDKTQMKRAIFTKCCQIFLSDPEGNPAKGADRYPIIIWHPDRTEKEEIIGHVYICRECHLRTPFDPGGHTSKFRGDWARRLPQDILKGMDREARRFKRMNGLSYLEAAGPGVAYWLIENKGTYEPLRHTKEPEPFEEIPEAKNAWQPEIEEVPF